MNYKEFENELNTTLHKIVDLEAYNIVFQGQLKNNGQYLDGVVIKAKDNIIAPIIYLDSWYDEYLRGKSIEDIAEGIYNLTCKSMNNISPDDIPKLDWDAIKERLTVAVINADANVEMLVNTPHRRIEDLAVIPKILVKGDTLGNGTIRVTKEILGKIGKTKDEVLNQAINNTNQLNFSCRNMYDVLKDNIGVDSDMMDELYCSTQRPQMYVVTLPNGIDGASILACRERLQNVVESIGDDVYILPSSTDEVLMIPKKSGIDVESLANMVHEVNRTEVAPDKILSDNVYQYDRVAKKLSIATAGIVEKHVPVRGKAKHMSV